MRLATLMACFMGSLSAARAAQEPGSPWIETRFNRVHLRNGNTIDGQLVRELKGSVVLQLKVGEMEIRRDMIDRVETVRMRSLREAVAPPPPKKAETAVVIQKPAEPEKTETEVKTIAPPSTGFASSVPQEVRNKIDGIIHGWIAEPSHLRGDLSQKLEPLSADGVRYLCALLEEKPRRVPAIPLSAALGRKRDPSSVASLAKALETGPQMERRAMVEALAQIGVPESVPPILQALEDGSTAVSRAASDALVELHTRLPQARVLDTLLARVDRAKDKTAYALTLGSIGGDDAYRGLLFLARSSDDQERLAGLQGLMKSFRPEDGDLIMPSLNSPSPIVRKQACALLGRAKYKPAVRPLIELLGEEDAGLVSDAHRALQDITGQTLARDINLWKSWWEVAGSREISK